MYVSGQPLSRTDYRRLVHVCVVEMGPTALQLLRVVKGRGVPIVLLAILEPRVSGVEHGVSNAKVKLAELVDIV